jgi:hypothetical protein
MCCFSEPVEDVLGTKIFARLENGRQFLVYQMMFSSKEDLAMILPIPVTPEAEEGAVEFISLEHFPGFFPLLNLRFPSGDDSELEGYASFDESEPALKVHQVGSFDASYVPGFKDFSRLDKRFRLPDHTLDQITEYRDYGFVVFKLAHGKNLAVHPMAFSFPTRRREALFFPTIHIHNGEYHDSAVFDHSLYCQNSRGVEGWEKTYGILGKEWDASFSDEEGLLKPISILDAGNDPAASKIVDREGFCFRKKISGKNKNEDQWVLL